jgi:hypothetical protein
MKRSVLLGYQLTIGLSDTVTGALLIVAPELTVRLMGLHVQADALAFLSFIGAFVLAVGLCCLFGAFVIGRRGGPGKLEVVWLVTGVIRGSVAIFLFTEILAKTMEAGWLAVAVFDGGCVLMQAVGLRKGWAADAGR